eukprot:669987-Hanusia_phi.AAC.1
MTGNLFQSCPTMMRPNRLGSRVQCGQRQILNNCDLSWHVHLTGRPKEFRWSKNGCGSREAGKI